MTSPPTGTAGLIFISLILPASCVICQCVRRRSVEVNHILLFTTGFWLYWILPIGIGVMGIFREEFWMRTWYDLFDALQPSVLDAYLIVCLGNYLAFTSGSVLSSRVFVADGRDLHTRVFDGKLLLLFFAPLLLASATFAFVLRRELFTGYKNIAEDFGFRGSFTAATLLLLGLALIDLTNRDRQSAPRSTRRFSSLYLWAYFFFAVLVLSLGGRLYFISSVLMLLVYHTVYIRRVRLILVVGLAVCAATIAGLIGLYRLGSMEGASAILVNLVSEFLFTSFSLVHFLGNASLDLIRFPVFLLSDFTNLLPLFLFPAKADFLTQPEAAGYVVFAPGGALNSFMSFMINFGILGTLCVLFLMGFGLNYLRLRRNSLLSRVTYVMLSGWLAFTFFRDPFSISIVKNMFEFSILFPFLLVAGLHVLTIVATVSKSASVGPSRKSIRAAGGPESLRASGSADPRPIVRETED